MSKKLQAMNIQATADQPVRAGVRIVPLFVNIVLVLVLIPTLTGVALIA